MKFVRNRILNWARDRKPDFVIGGADRPYLLRHWLIPRNRLFNIYVHQFLRSDDDRALHDHPWLFNCSWLLAGAYIEWAPPPDEHLMPDLVERCQHAREEMLIAGDWKFRWGRAPHRVELFEEIAFDPAVPGRLGLSSQPKPAWTLFITGPRVRDWGFYCPSGFVDWKKFTSPDDKGSVGKGCEA